MKHLNTQRWYWVRFSLPRRYYLTLMTVHFGILILCRALAQVVKSIQLTQSSSHWSWRHQYKSPVIKAHCIKIYMWGRFSPGHPSHTGSLFKTSIKLKLPQPPPFTKSNCFLTAAWICAKISEGKIERWGLSRKEMTHWMGYWGDFHSQRNNLVCTWCSVITAQGWVTYLPEIMAFQTYQHRATEPNTGFW